MALLFRLQLRDTVQSTLRALFVLCATTLAALGQTGSFAACTGNNLHICASSGAYVGIGTQNPNFPLTLQTTLTGFNFLQTIMGNRGPG